MNDNDIIQQYMQFVGNKEFPCVAARAAVTENEIRCFVTNHMACPAHDHSILQFLYDFVDAYRSSNKRFQSAAVIFREPTIYHEMEFDALIWQKLNALTTLDKQKYRHDPRVDADPASPYFSYSLKEEAFFIIGLHRSSNRASRRFAYPVLVFNPHEAFEKLRASHRYEAMKDIVRKRDLIYSGSVNPMLSDFGDASEVFQYTGIQYAAEWKCPLINRHNEKKHHSTP
jgi:FPC/CPF motif-containing protein YcgG